ncbi:hypothetical protein OESDEN_19056 [Oesophagostomum dentatum]|uniref:Uncharacterized protein n=1 Tax=Oesophagostomum dentatum TaxID=61180 RepID=A0A0B1S7H7_OESDE|nr:hypothetical protein OESDEN_19056 [Oesophagostomum dentatum]
MIDHFSEFRVFGRTVLLVVIDEEDEILERKPVLIRQSAPVHAECREEPKRKKTSNMHPAENELLFKLVANNFTKYNQKFRTDWAAQITALGFSSRNADQISEKVRKGIEKARNAIDVENRRITGTGGGADPPPVDLPFYLEPIREVLRGEHNVAGVLRLSDDEENDFGITAEECVVATDAPAPMSRPECSPTPLAEVEELSAYDSAPTAGKTRCSIYGSR